MNNFLKHGIYFLAIILGFNFSPKLLVAQKYEVTRGQISFSIVAPAGKLEASNNLITGYIQAKSGQMYFQIEIKGFEFSTPHASSQKNETTKKRFLEYYMENDLYPFATFQGKIKDLNKINFSKKGTYSVKAEGTATVHGVFQKMILDFTLTVGENLAMTLTLNRPVQMEYFDIKKPVSLLNVLFEEAMVDINCNLEIVK